MINRFKKFRYKVTFIWFLYTFVLLTFSFISEWGDYSFDVKFLLIVFFIISGMFAILADLLFNERKRTLEQQYKIKVQLLQSQMNPHFIYNAINTVQNAFQSGNNSEGLSSLENFTGIMRLTLDNSAKDQIPLDEEIKYLKLYVSLEQARFRNKFDFEFLIADDIITDSYSIPPMLIQPFVENAIKHGLLNKKEKGLLKIKITKNEVAFNCTVSDNGIGREAARKIENTLKKHESKGIDLINERIKLLNKSIKKSKQKFEIEISDQTNESSAATGTKVIVNIPL